MTPASGWTNLLSIIQQDPMCQQREVYLTQYREAVRTYGAAVLYMDPDLRIKEFEDAHRRAERARAAFDRARKGLKEH